MGTLPTIKVEAPDPPRGWKVINAADFDPAVRFTVYRPVTAVKGRKYRGGTPPRYYGKCLFNSISEAHSGESRHHRGKGHPQPS